MRKFGETKYTLRKMVGLAASAIFSFSIKPLRLAIVLGALSAVLAILILVAIFMKIVGSPVAGWTTLTVMIAFSLEFNCYQLVLGEYVGRAFIKQKIDPNI